MLSSIVGLLLVSNMVVSTHAGVLRVSFGAAESNRGLDSADRKITQITLSSISHPEWAKGKSYDENLHLCLKTCAENVECKGVQISPRSWDHQECFLMRGGKTFSRYGWTARVKHIKDVTMGGVLSNKGLDSADRKISQMTLSSISHPEWAKGKSYSENLNICVDKCYAHFDCKGIQIAPRSWNHQECFLMKGGEPYSRSGWSARVIIEKDVSLGAAQANKGLDSADRKITQITLSSISHPEWAKGKSYAENLELCSAMCLHNAECKGIQISPRYWNHQECFLMKGGATFNRPSWEARVKIIH